jgi:hypothetical protein
MTSDEVNFDTNVGLTTSLSNWQLQCAATCHGVDLLHWYIAVQVQIARLEICVVP